MAKTKATLQITMRKDGSLEARIMRRGEPVGVSSPTNLRELQRLVSIVTPKQWVPVKIERPAPKHQLINMSLPGPKKCIMEGSLGCCRPGIDADPGKLPIQWRKKEPGLLARIRRKVGYWIAGV